MSAPAPDRVAAASAAWVWFPPEARTIDADGYLVVRFPAWFRHQLELTRLRMLDDLGGALDAARSLAAGEVSEITVWVKLDAPDGLDDLLRVRGGVPDETLDVLALDLADGAPDLGPVPVDAELRWVDTVEDYRGFERVVVEVFGGREAPEEHLVAETERARQDQRTEAGGRLVALAGGTPVGSGGLSLVDGDARLWGGAVAIAHRGRGIYRALLGERLRWSAEHGATLGLVKGRIETSGPILRRAGFAVFGQERSYTLPL